MKGNKSDLKHAVELLEKAGYTVFDPGSIEKMAPGYLEGCGIPDYSPAIQGMPPVVHMMPQGGNIEHKLVKIGDDHEAAEKRLDKLVQEGWWFDRVMDHGLLLYIRSLQKTVSFPQQLPGPIGLA